MRTATTYAILLLTDVPAVFRHYGSEDQIAIGKATPEALNDLELAPGSMGPKVGAAIAFVRASGKLAGIGQLTDARAILEGRAGTRVLPDKTKSSRHAGSSQTTSGFTGADQSVSVWLDDGGAIV